MMANVPVQKCDDCDCIISRARETNTHIQLIGGWAIFYRTKDRTVSRNYDFLQRSYADIDIVGKSKEKRKIFDTLSKCGYVSDDRFNGLYGDSRLLFRKGSEVIDVFLDKFEMCHTLDLSDTLNYLDDTIGVGELLFTKLQIVEINEKDIKDAIRLIFYSDLEDKGRRDYNPKDFLVEACSEDWGVYKTITLNLGKVSDYAKTLQFVPEDLEMLNSKIEIITKSIENSDKSIRWKMRSKIGEKVRWYELPEEKKR